MQQHIEGDLNKIVVLENHSLFRISGRDAKWIISAEVLLHMLIPLLIAMNNGININNAEQVVKDYIELFLSLPTEFQATLVTIGAIAELVVLFSLYAFFTERFVKIDEKTEGE